MFLLPDILCNADDELA